MLDNIRDKTFLLVCTVRYCLNRQYYAVGWIRDILKNSWNKIPKNDKKVILEDIKQHKKTHGFSDIDLKIWDEILELGIKDNLIIKGAY